MYPEPDREDIAAADCERTLAGFPVREATRQLQRQAGHPFEPPRDFLLRPHSSEQHSNWTFCPVRVPVWNGTIAQKPKMVCVSGPSSTTAF